MGNTENYLEDQLFGQSSPKPPLMPPPPTDSFKKLKIIVVVIVGLYVVDIMLSGNRTFAQVIKENLMLLLAVIVCCTVHEFAHAWTANAFGDPTAKHLNRLSLNPVYHIDPIGLLLFFLGGMGWAKPVPVKTQNLMNPDRGMIYISLAGPLSNLILAFLGGFLLKVEMVYLKDLFSQHALMGTLVLEFTTLFIVLNIGLAFFNLFPIPPLDGSKILMYSLPTCHRHYIESLESVGEMLLVLVVSFGLTRPILAPLVKFTYGLILSIFIGKP